MAYYQNAKDMYIEDFVGTDFYIEEGSNFYDLIFPFYMRISYLTQIADQVTCKTNMTDALNNGYSKYVDKIADQLGVFRKHGTHAIVPVLIKGKPNKRTNKQVIVGTLDNRLYVTESAVEFDDNGEFRCNAISQKEGSAYNVKAGEICNLPVKYADIISVINEADYNDAYDEEDDRDLAERYYLALQNNKTSGNVNHYKSWALEVTGCGYCKVIPLWDKDNGMNGKGSVKLIIANSNKRQASAELIKDVKDHIGAVDGTGEAPIGADVTVISYTEKTVNIDMNVLIDENTTLDIVKENMKKVLENYLNDLDVDTTKVRIFDIYKAITKVDGLIDADAIKLNGIESNIDLNDEIPILGTITLTERVI